METQETEEEGRLLQGKEIARGKKMKYTASHGMCRSWQEHRFVWREFSMLIERGLLRILNALLKA